MSLSFLIPVIVLLGSAVLLGLSRWPLPPQLAVRTLALVAVMTAGTVAALTATTAAGFALGPARRAEIIEWCRIVPVHHEVGPLLGVASISVVVAMTARVVLLLRVRQRSREGTEGRRISVLETEEPVAYAVPGKPGCVVVSTGLLGALQPRERQVLFAHERAHLRQRHHRYLLAAAIAVAVVPLLRPLGDRVRLATERCADEAAVNAVGGDRQLVASAIAKAAMTTTRFNGLAPAFSGGPVVERVRALIGTPTATSSRLGYAAIVAGPLVALGAGSVQFHHLWVSVDHVCHG